MLHSDCHVLLYVCLDNFCVTCIRNLEWLLGVTVVLLWADASVFAIYKAQGIPECVLMTHT